MKILAVLNTLGVTTVVLLGCTSCVSIDYSSFMGSGEGYGGSPYVSSYRAPVGVPYGGGSSGFGYGYGGGHSGDRYCEEERIKLTGGSQRGKGTRPQEYHTRDWYEKRGYDLDNYKHKHKNSGKTHEGEDYKGSKKKR